jgi:hypothetical protein
MEEGWIGGGGVGWGGGGKEENVTKVGCGVVGCVGVGHPVSPNLKRKCHNVEGGGRAAGIKMVVTVARLRVEHGSQGRCKWGAHLPATTSPSPKRVGPRVVTVARPAAVGGPFVAAKQG